MTNHNEIGKTKATDDMSSTDWKQIRRVGILTGALIVVSVALIAWLLNPELLLSGGLLTWGIVASLVVVGVLLVVRYSP